MVSVPPSWFAGGFNLGGAISSDVGAGISLSFAHQQTSHCKDGAIVPAAYKLRVASARLPVDGVTRIAYQAALRIGTARRRASASRWWEEKEEEREEENALTAVPVIV